MQSVCQAGPSDHPDPLGDLTVMLSLFIGQFSAPPASSRPRKHLAMHWKGIFLYCL